MGWSSGLALCRMGSAKIGQQLQQGSTASAQHSAERQRQLRATRVFCSSRATTARLWQWTKIHLLEGPRHLMGDRAATQSGTNQAAFRIELIRKAQRRDQETEAGAPLTALGLALVSPWWCIHSLRCGPLRSWLASVRVCERLPQGLCSGRQPQSHARGPERKYSKPQETSTSPQLPRQRKTWNCPSSLRLEQGSLGGRRHLLHFEPLFPQAVQELLQGTGGPKDLASTAADDRCDHAGGRQERVGRNRVSRRRRRRVPVDYRARLVAYGQHPALLTVPPGLPTTRACRRVEHRGA